MVIYQMWDISVVFPTKKVSNKLFFDGNIENTISVVLLNNAILMQYVICNFFVIICESNF